MLVRTILRSSSRVERGWNAAPLPMSFHVALEAGDWKRALHIYQRHPFHAPPADTFDLLKTVMHATGIGMADVKSRFNEKVRLSVILQRKTSEEVEWGLFWKALNQGDGHTISAAFAGANVSSSAQQIALAEACAVLLKSTGVTWHEKLIDNMPFATVTRRNLVHVALSSQRWDVAIEMLRHVRLSRSDLTTVWPLMTQFSWEKVLSLISACPKSSVPYNTALPFILQRGCSLQALSEHLEQARVLSDADVVAPLLSYAIEVKDWNYVQRGVAHLVDIGQITSTVHKTFEHLCHLHGWDTVCQRLRSHRIDISAMTIENLESLKL